MLQLFFTAFDIASKGHVGYNDRDEWFKCQNNKTEIDQMLKGLPKGSIIALESTGGYGLMLAERAWRKGFVVYMLVPGRVKHFCMSSPSRGKTDKIDARDIADYVRAFVHRLNPYQPLPAFERRLRSLARKKEALADKLASIGVQLRSLGDKPSQIKQTLKGLVDRLQKLDAEIKAMLANAEDAQVLFKIPCVKTNLVAAVLPALRTIPFKNKYSLDSYAGIDLKPNESGRFKGKRSISHQGDPHIRRAVYLAGFSAIRSKAWRDYYRSLIEDKKLRPVQAINAMGRKILHVVYGVYKSQKEFVAPT